MENSDNPFAHVLLAAKISLLEDRLSDERLLEVKVLAANRLQEKGFDDMKITAVFTFLRNYVLFKNPEINRIFDDRIKQLDKYNIMNTLEYVAMENREEGRKEGRKEGRAEYRVAIVKNLIQSTRFSDERIAAIVGVSVSFVNNIRLGKKK